MSGPWKELIFLSWLLGELQYRCETPLRCCWYVYWYHFIYIVNMWFVAITFTALSLAIPPVWLPVTQRRRDACHSWLGSHVMITRTSHTSKFSNPFCCKCHKGEVYCKKQSFTSTSSEIYYWKWKDEVKLGGEVKQNNTPGFCQDWTKGPNARNL